MWYTSLRIMEQEIVLDRSEALGILADPSLPTAELVERACGIRERHFGQKVVLHVLTNARSGHCSEDCSFCSQSSRHAAGIEEFPLKAGDTLLEEARAANRLGAGKFCIVTATRQATPTLLDGLCPAVERIKAELPAMKICLSLGFLSRDSARRIRAAGADRYNHNIETSERYYPSLVSTHRWIDRVETIRIAREAGLEICCGGVLGAGESVEDRVDFLLALRDLEVDSAPINFLDPRPGTPLSGLQPLEPDEALRLLALARLILPSVDIRAAGGREKILGPRQADALRCVTSIFTNGYLTTPGQGLEADEALVRSIGYEAVREWD